MPTKNVANQNARQEFNHSESLPVLWDNPKTAKIKHTKISPNLPQMRVQNLSNIKYDKMMMMIIIIPLL